MHIYIYKICLLVVVVVVVAGSASPSDLLCGFGGRGSVPKKAAKALLPAMAMKNCSSYICLMHPAYQRFLWSFLWVKKSPSEWAFFWMHKSESEWFLWVKKSQVA